MPLPAYWCICDCVSSVQSWALTLHVTLTEKGLRDAEVRGWLVWLESRVLLNLPFLIGMKKVAEATFLFILLALLRRLAVAPAELCAQVDQL